MVAAAPVTVNPLPTPMNLWLTGGEVTLPAEEDPEEPDDGVEGDGGKCKVLPTKWLVG